MLPLSEWRVHSVHRECEVCLLNVLLVAALYHIIPVFFTSITLDHALILPGWHRHGFLRYCHDFLCYDYNLYFPCCNCHVLSYLKKKNQPHLSFSSVRTSPHVWVRYVSSSICHGNHEESTHGLNTTNDLLHQHVLKVVELLNGGNKLHESREDNSKELLDDKDVLHLVA